MKLFDDPADPNKNQLPYDGQVYYYGKIIGSNQADYYLNALLKNIAWKNDEAVIFGKRIVTERKVAWYGEQDFAYTYSNTTKYALPWTKELLELKLVVEQQSEESFNSCLLNLYHTGKETMAWHSDAETDLKKYGTIASLSFGAERKFSFKHKDTKEKIELILEHGSLLIMSGTTQSHWLHRLPPSTRIHTPRVNLTFRTIIQ